MDANKKKVEMLNALELHLGNVTEAAATCKISRATHYNWLDCDPMYAESVEEIKDSMIDLVESEAFKQIKKGDTAMIIFFLKTRGAKRGYREKSEIQHTYGDLPDDELERKAEELRAANKIE